MNMNHVLGKLCYQYKGETYVMHKPQNSAFCYYSWPQ